MGTTIPEYLREAHRVMKAGGILKIAEVKSRFETKQLGGIQVNQRFDLREYFDISFYVGIYIAIEEARFRLPRKR